MVPPAARMIGQIQINQFFRLLFADDNAVFHQVGAGYHAGDFDGIKIEGIFFFGQEAARIDRHFIFGPMLKNDDGFGSVVADALAIMEFLIALDEWMGDIRPAARHTLLQQVVINVCDLAHAFQAGFINI
ncbi:MAG: hypothetical protein BWY71_02157 [Planctomycetes bacterium ADurb.Bin412]|nr:MAG: hypothetical protein BWY71_02157 [Planctomycetes bacterium ADurb.Bin412]